jgi:hypothetical protein
MLPMLLRMFLLVPQDGAFRRREVREREGGRIPAATRCTGQHVPAYPVGPILFPAASSPPTLRASSHRHHRLSRLQPHLSPTVPHLIP